MSFTDFKEVANVDTGDTIHYGSDQLLEVLKIFNAKIVANRRVNIKNPWRFSDKIELMAPVALPTAPTATNYINLVLDPADFHLKVQANGGALSDLQSFSLDTNTLAYTSANNILGDLLKNNATKYVRFARGNQDEVLTATATDLQYQKIVNANVSATAAVAWTKIDKTGSKIKDMADAATMNPTNGQVPTWNTGASRWDAATPPGSGTGEANTASNIGTAGTGIFKQKTAVNLEFKKVNAGSSKITITDDTVNNELDIDVAQANLTLSSLGGSITDSQYPNTPTGKTYNIDTNTVKHSTTNAQGDILAYDTGSAKYIRIPRGTTGQYLRSTGTDLAWQTATIPNVFGGINIQSGNGTTKIFTIAHGAGTTPTKYAVTPASDIANRAAQYNDSTAARHYVTADATNLTITYFSAPTTGTNNLSWAWLVFT